MPLLCLRNRMRGAHELEHIACRRCETGGLRPDLIICIMCEFAASFHLGRCIRDNACVCLPARPRQTAAPVERLAWSAFTCFACFNCVTGLPGRGTNEITQMAASYTAPQPELCVHSPMKPMVSTVEYRMSMCMAVLQCSSLTYRPACPHSPTDTASPQPARCIPFPNRREVDLGKGSEGTEVAPRGLHL